MRHLEWCEGGPPAAPPRVRVERFCRSARYRVWMLGEVRVRMTHFTRGENSVPCLAPAACPFCTDPQWKKRPEGYAPALVKKEREGHWLPIVAVYTAGGVNQLGAGPHRGRLLDVKRQEQGNSSVLKLAVLNTIEPPIPGFDVTPHLLRLWFPNDESVPPAVIPDPIPFAPPEVNRPADPAPLEFTPQQREQLQARLRDGLKAKGVLDPAADAPALDRRAAHTKRVITTEQKNGTTRVRVEGEDGTSEGSHPDPVEGAKRDIRGRLRGVVETLGQMPEPAANGHANGSARKGREGGAR